MDAWKEGEAEENPKDFNTKAKERKNQHDRLYQNQVMQIHLTPSLTNLTQMTLMAINIQYDLGLHGDLLDLEISIYIIKFERSEGVE